MKYQPIIGLEIHIQLKTARKMFCGCDANIWQAEPNTHVCPVCLGLPGALPAPNKKAIELTQRMGLALNCELAQQSKFDRKSYFYPDLPKGYQISQFDLPLAREGQLALKAQDSRLKEDTKIRIRRVHLEEDTAKSIHKKGVTLIDFNKSGIPLMEIVTEPDMRSAKQAVEFGKKIQQVARWVGVTDANMERGQLRIELNISMRKTSSPKPQIPNSKLQTRELPGYKVEVKNINSFRFLGRIIEYEMKRQAEILEKGEVPRQETRGWNEKGETSSQRFKETEADYRYFPEPDLPPLEFSQKYLDRLKLKLPVLPDELKDKYAQKYNLPEHFFDQLVSSPKVVRYFEELIKLGLKPKKVADLVINTPEIMRQPPEKVARMEKRKKAEVIDSKEELQPVIKEVIGQNPDPVRQYQNGKSEVLKFLIGQVMRKTHGRASPQLTRNLLQRTLSQA